MLSTPMQPRELKATDWGGLTRSFLRESISLNYRIQNRAGWRPEQKTLAEFDIDARMAIFVTVAFERVLHFEPNGGIVNPETGFSTRKTTGGFFMNLTISGHHLEVTPSLRSYVTNKLDRIVRHFDQVVDVKVLLTVEKQKEKKAASERNATSTSRAPTCLPRVHTLICTPPSTNWWTSLIARWFATRRACKNTITRRPNALCKTSSFQAEQSGRSIERLFFKCDTCVHNLTPNYESTRVHPFPCPGSGSG